LNSGEFSRRPSCQACWQDGRRFVLFLRHGGNHTFDFVVGPVSGGGENNGRKVSALPATGFAPNRVTVLPSQPADLAYSQLGYIWLEIPSLNVKANIVGVPQSDNGWDMTWLGKDIGWLNGTAFPTWQGNSVLTAHVYDANGLPGPFVNLKNLKYGDQIIIHLSGQKYIFEVRQTKLVRPDVTEFALQHLERHAYLTLITCQIYNPLNDSYLFRHVVRAVLVSVTSE
jgi:LPXTG-site transpeptidase (sortase) family protein